MTFTTTATSITTITTGKTNWNKCAFFFRKGTDRWEIPLD